MACRAVARQSEGWCSRPEGLSKPCDMDALNELARYRELQSHWQPQPSEGCALIIEPEEQSSTEPLAGAALMGPVP